MNPQERAIIDGIFERLKNVANQPRDPEVDRYIADLIRQQPYAPYAMAQSVYVQEQALLNQQRQIEEMNAELERLRQNQAPAQSGGFLSSLFGGGATRAPAQSVPAFGGRPGAGYPPQGPGQYGMGQNGMGQNGMGQPAMPPPGYAPQPGPWGQPAQPRQGMGFLGTAAAAAAGVAGGMMLGNVLSNALGGGQAHAAEPQPFGGMGQTPEAGPASQTEAAEPDYSNDMHAANYDDGGYDSGGFDGGDSYDV